MKRAFGLLSLPLLLCSSLAFAQEQPSEPQKEPAKEIDPGYDAPAPPPPSSQPVLPAAPTVNVEPMAPDADRATPEGPPRFDFIRANAGLKLGYIGNRAYDTFSSDDVLPQASIDGTYTFLTSGRLALAAGAGWDVGASHAKLRGGDAYLTAHRLYVPIEARLHFRSWYAFGKVSPGAAGMVGWVKDASAPSGEISRTGWAFSTDASVGASVLLGPRSNLDKRGVRFWLTPEVGYAYTTAATMRMDPGRDENDQLGVDQHTGLRSLALSGFFWRASVGFTY